MPMTQDEIRTQYEQQWKVQSDVNEKPRDRARGSLVLSHSHRCHRRLARLGSDYGKIPRTLYTFPMFSSAAMYDAVRMSQLNFCRDCVVRRAAATMCRLSA